jgi:hypothetical protein
VHADDSDDEDASAEEPTHGQERTTTADPQVEAGDSDDDEDQDVVDVPIQVEEAYSGPIHPYSKTLTAPKSVVYCYFRSAPRGWYSGVVVEELEDAYGHKVQFLSGWSVIKLTKRAYGSTWVAPLPVDKTATTNLSPNPTDVA